MIRLAFVIAFVPFSLVASAIEAADNAKPPDVAKRYIIKVNKIDPKEAKGVILKNSVSELSIAGPISNLINPGDTLTVKVKGAVIATLTMSEPCELKVAKDKTLLATEEKVVAKDPKGKTWVSRKVQLGKEEVIAFFQEDAP